MKKIILTALSTLAFGLVSAQEVKFGAKAGVNVASVTLEQQKEFTLSPRYGINIGFFAEIKVSDKFSVQPELLYSMQGNNSSFSESFLEFTFSSKETASINYLNIPIMAKFYVVEKLSFQAGPQIGILFSATSTIETSGNNPRLEYKTVSESKEKILNKIDFGLNFGAGYDITENISIDARYNFGLSGLKKELEQGETAVKNRVFSINVGYKF